MSSKMLSVIPKNATYLVERNHLKVIVPVSDAQVKNANDAQNSTWCVMMLSVVLNDEKWCWKRDNAIFFPR